MNPEDLRSSLTRLARNYRWTWSIRSQSLLDRLPGEGHPVGRVAEVNGDTLAALASDPTFTETVHSELGELDRLVDGAPPPTIAYCSPEFGLSAHLPQYAGGLGVLAGDHLKTASDLGVPLCGVGLFYREGVFHQAIEEGAQSEVYHPVYPPSVGAEDTGVVVRVPFPGREVAAKVWRIDVGRVPLLLLDTDVEPNSDEDRAITDRLYTGDRQHRLDQEMVLGVGGARALVAMGWEIEVHHLNEGHAGFIVLELIDRINGDADWEQARDQVRKGLVFTTHTPVPAGIDRFALELIRPYLEVWAQRWARPFEWLWELGADPDDPEAFNMAALALRSAARANGVSQLHGEVSRKLFAGVGIGDEITHITNGVHARTWTAPHVQDLFDEALGVGWEIGDPEAWERVAGIDDATLQGVRGASTRRLARLVRERTGRDIDTEALVVGFARRFAPYKRASLLLRHPERLEGMLADGDRPLQFVFAGKAHPSDPTGKGLVSELVAATAADRFGGRIVFVPDYDMEIALALVEGCHVWLNNPIRPREASGTSGEKAVLNGSLNCSILDGWWAEMYDGRNGWEIPASRLDDPEARDEEEAGSMLATLDSVVNEYHRARAVFLGRVRHAWATLGPRVVAARMLREYQDTIYRL